MPKQMDQSFLNLPHNTSTSSVITYASFNMSEQLDEGEESVVEEDINAHFQDLAPMTRHALGRDAKIGAQYNGHLDQFCKENIFSGITTFDINITYPPKCADVNIIEQNLFETKVKIMHIENELQVSLLSDTITPPNQVKIKTVSQEFLMSKFTNKQRVTLTFSECLQKTELKDLAQMANRIELRFISQQATHIVAGYEWGIFLALQLIIPVPNNENEKMVLQKIKPYMAMIKECVINQQDRVIFMDPIRHERFHIKLYTTEIQEYELTLDEIINLVRAEIKQMKEANKRRRFKLRYTLWPISLLTQISNNIRLNELPLVSTSSSILEILIQQRNLLETRFAEISDYMQNYANFINDKILDDVRNTKAECEKIYKNLQSKYRDSIIFIRQGDNQKGLELWSYIETDYNYLVQQLNVFLSGDQESFFNKIHYIDYLTQRQVSYLGKNINCDEFIQPIKEGYVFFCCWNEVDSNINEDGAGNESGDGELQYFDKLLNDQKNCLFVDQDLMLNPKFPNQCRICQIKNGKILIEDLLNRYIPRTNICLAIPEKNRFVEYMSRPDKAVQFEICCPRSTDEYGDLKCRNTPHFWYCNECYQCFWYFDTYLYCACGKARVLTFVFRCNDPPHGQNFIKYNQETLREILSQIQPMRDIHILVLGCTGVGKSTWMNGFANYLTFSTLQEARNSENVTLIPTEFTIFTRKNNRTVEQTIRVGESEYEKLSTGASATQFPKAYVFTTRNLRIHLIDTPGIGDTHGAAQDVENLGTIMRYLENYEELHGICIFLKPNETRLNLMFKYCVNEFLTHLHKDAVKNIMFCFTNARGTNYMPGDTLAVLKGYLEVSLKEDKIMDGVKIKLNDDHVYCLDSESIRFLYAEHVGVLFDNDEVEGCTKSWNTSQKTTARLINHVLTLPPHKMRDMISVNDSRRIINILSGPLANLSNLINLNIATINNKKEELRRLDNNSSMENIRNQLYTPHYYLENEELENPRTVCASPNCTYKPNFDNNKEVQEVIYTQICCDSCPLTVTPVNQTGVPQLKNCEAFKYENGEFKELCKKCGCDYSVHMHMTHHQKIDFKLVRSDIQARNTKEAIEEYLKECEKTKQQLKQEQKIIVEACSKFGAFLKTYAIMANNDAYREYLDKEIQAENRFSVEARNHKKLAELERMLAEFKEQECIFLQTGSTNSNAMIEPKDIQETLCTLFGLPHMGEIIQKIHDEAIDAQAQYFAFSENNVKQPNIDALALEEAKINADVADTAFSQLALAPEEVDKNKVEIKKSPKSKQKKKEDLMFSWIYGRVGHVVEQVDTLFGFTRSAKPRVTYIQEEATPNPTPAFMQERKQSMDQISNNSFCTNSSTTSSPSYTMYNDTMINKRHFYQAKQNDQQYYNEEQQKPTEKRCYIPPHLKQPNIDNITNQMKDLHNQKSTSNSQNLLKMKQSCNPKPENTSRPTNPNFNQNPSYQQYTQNYPNSVSDNVYSPHPPTSPGNIGQSPIQPLNFNQNAEQGNNDHARHFPRN